MISTWRFCLLLLCVSVAHASNEGIQISNWPSTQAMYQIPAQSVMSLSAAVSIAPVQLVKPNASRRGLILYNNSTTPIYIAYDTTVSSTTHTTYIIPASSGWSMPFPIYQGQVTAIRGATGDGKVMITELQ